MSLYRHTATAFPRSQASRADAVSAYMTSIRSYMRSHGVAAPASVTQASSARIGIGKQSLRMAVLLPRFRTMRLLVGGRPRAGPEAKGVARTLARGRPWPPLAAPGPPVGCVRRGRRYAAQEAPLWPSLGDWARAACNGSSQLRHRLSA